MTAKCFVAHRSFERRVFSDIFLFNCFVSHRSFGGGSLARVEGLLIIYRISKVLLHVAVPRRRLLCLPLGGRGLFFAQAEGLFLRRRRLL